MITIWSISIYTSKHNNHFIETLTKRSERSHNIIGRRLKSFGSIWSMIFGMIKVSIHTSTIMKFQTVNIFIEFLSSKDPNQKQPQILMHLHLTNHFVFYWAFYFNNSKITWIWNYSHNLNPIIWRHNPLTTNSQQLFLDSYQNRIPR